MTDQNKGDNIEEGNKPPSALPDKDTSGPKVNPDLTFSQRKSALRPGDTYVRKNQPYRRLFRGTRGRLVATPESYTPVSRLARGLRILKTVFIGRPLFSREEIRERLTKFKALAVFGSDAISSSTYATEASLVVLVVAGNGALHISFSFFLLRRQKHF